MYINTCKYIYMTYECLFQTRNPNPQNGNRQQSTHARNPAHRTRTPQPHSSNPNPAS